jgi:hypothetical protein
MSEQDPENPTQTGDLGPMPDAGTEPREPNPGGVDAMPTEEENLSADLDPEDNPALQTESPETVKEAVSEGEDTDTEATKNGQDVAPEDESPA